MQNIIFSIVFLHLSCIRCCLYFSYTSLDTTDSFSEKISTVFPFMIWVSLNHVFPGYENTYVRVYLLFVSFSSRFRERSRLISARKRETRIAPTCFFLSLHNFIHFANMTTYLYKKIPAYFLSTLLTTGSTLLCRLAFISR